MAPKRKRSDAPSSEGSRPSPHRPADTALGQHDRDGSSNRGRNRGHRGGQRRDSSHAQNRGSSSSQSNQSPTPARPAIPAQAQPQAAQPQQHAAPATPKPVMRQPAPEPMPPAKTNHRYETLTQEAISSWGSGGREKILQHGIQSRDDVDVTELSSLFTDFVHAVVEAKLSPSEAGSCMKEILGDPNLEVTKDSYSFAPHTLFLDSLAIIMENDPEIYRPTLREFLMATGVSPTLMRQVLDAPLLQQLDLIRDTFARVGVRQATNLLYRQANYNLLREESEGYSKLITELFAAFNTSPPPLDLAEETFEKIKALIGTFDLDVGRVLDVTLDVVAALLIKQHKFWVKLLRVSSWWPRSQIRVDKLFTSTGLPIWAQPGYLSWSATEEDEAIGKSERLARDVAFWNRARAVHLAAYFELGGLEITEAHQRELAIVNGAESDENELDAAAALERQWIKETKTLPPAGNRVAAQLLGFKMLFYFREFRDKTDVLPANLLYLVTVLIKIGFISLLDLYPHLSPNDKDMEQVREARAAEMEKEMRASRGGSMNALLMAGVLPQGDDDNPASSAIARREAARKADGDKGQAAQATAEKPEEKPLEQKVSLLIELLTIGALPESLFILGKFPWILDLYPDALKRLHRILHVAVDKVYNDSRPRTRSQTTCQEKRVADFDQTGMPKGNVRLSDLPPKKILRWPYPDMHESANQQGATYRYYWDGWDENIPVCQSVEDIFTLCDTLLNLSGVNIGKDEALLTKLASIGAKSLNEDSSEANLSRWQVLLRRLLVPALSHTSANAAAVNAIWTLLRRYPITTRYAIYAEWFEGQISRLPAMKEAFAQATSKTRGTMKRVSLTNLSEMAKQLAKISYSSPGIVFRVAFEQLESYPNLIEAFVECAKYFTDLSYDVLVWSLMNSLGKSRSRTQADHALTTSKWLTALSKFSGKVFRRYSVLNTTPVLQYVNDQLLQGNSTDLVILKELISSMGGIVDSGDFTDYQIMSMAGGQFLRRHTLIRGQDRRFENITSSKRLIHALTQSKLGARLLIALAQYRQAALFQVPEDQAHIKYLSWIVDDSQQILVQFLDFLWSNLDPSTYDDVVPPINELMTSYGLDTSLAFLIGRASLAHRMFPWKAKQNDGGKPKGSTPKASADNDGDVAMSESKPNGAQNPDAQGQDSAANDDQKSDDASLIRNTLQPIVDTVEHVVRPEAWQKISPELYVTFWALQLGDLFCPDKMYKQEREKLKSEELVISKDRSDMSRKGQERKMEKRKDLMNLQIGLSEENREHLLRQGKWKFHLTKRLQDFFPNPKAKPDAISDILLEQCFLPRVLLSIADAEYTFRFIKCLHEWNAPGFKLMSLYDRLFSANRLRSLIFTSSTREADYLGRFFKLILEDLTRWHKNEPLPKEANAAKDQPRVGVYDKEAKGPNDQPRLGFAREIDDNGKPTSFVEHDEFRDLLFRWHKNFNTALKSCLSGTEWMHIRNAITVLKAVLDFFPAVDFMATQFLAQLQKITEQESASKTAVETEEAHRVDLAVAAQGAMSELQKRKPRWVMVQAFRPNAVGGSQQDTDKGGAKLRATAAEFTPGSTTNPASKQTTAEEEDGEVKDGHERKAKKSDIAPPTGPARGNAKETLPPKPSTSLNDTPRRDGASSRGVPGGKAASSGTPQGGRGDSRPSSLPDRPPQNLPSRPDVPVPNHFHQGRANERRDGRETRDSRGTPRETRDGRDQRDHRESRSFEPERPDRGRDHSERRHHDAGPADLPPRPGAPEKDRQRRDSRGSRPGDRPSEGASATPRQGAPAEPAMNPERAALFAQEGPDRGSRGRHGSQDHKDPINPDRAARLAAMDNNTPTRPSRDQRRDQGPSRPGSPPRSGNENGPHAGDGRNGRSARDDRLPDREGPKGRDFGGFPKPGSRGAEGDYPARHQDSNYGRLNAEPQQQEIPSGPRSRGRGSNRSSMGGPQPASGRLPGPETPRAPSPERLPPSGPASGRGRRGGPDAAGGPATPSGPPGVPAMDRARNASGADTSSPMSNAVPAPGMHPDRLAQFGGPGNSQSSPIPTGPSPHGHGRHPIPTTNTPDRPPNGPRHQPGNMNGPPMDMPSGRSGGNKRQLAGINSMLQQAQANMPEQSRSSSAHSARRSQPRQMLAANSDVQVLTGGSPTPTPGSERADPMRSAGEDESHGRRDRDGRSSREGSRSSRHGGRDRDRERSPGRNRDGKEHRSHRERHSEGAAGASNAMPSGPREPMAPPMGPGGRDQRHGGAIRPGAGEDWPGAARGPRGPPREGAGMRQQEDRRDGREQGGRKRRSEEGVNNMSNDREKRPRR